MYCRDLIDVVSSIIGDLNYFKYNWYQEVLYGMINYIEPLVEFRGVLLVREDFDHEKT